MKNEKKLTKREENYSKWYNELIIKASLAENAAVRGCMVIKPYGYAIWERVQSLLDEKFKDTGHKNAYFPLFVPKSLFEAEEKNAEGFAKECAVVTHYRLKKDESTKNKLIVDPEAKLEEELIVRPTSEAIIWKTYQNWIKSYRDLPLKINQWANVVRWEMRTRLFLRTAEFLWQEGHTAHATKDEAMEETLLINSIYANFVEQVMGIPVIQGIKTEAEQFAGAEKTYCIEALMQDGKSLQAGTSHFLGQNFSKAFNVKYATKEGGLDFVWATSWGVSTRLMGALVMAHGDDNGLVLPPNIAPFQVVIIPIYKSKEDIEKIEKEVEAIKDIFREHNIRFEYDDRDSFTPGYKFNEYELKGVPIRISIGLRDIEKKGVEIARRDTFEKMFVPKETLLETIKTTLDDIQTKVFEKALNFRNNNITQVENFDDFKEILNTKGGYISAHWDGTRETEETIKKLTKATIRCIPMDVQSEQGKCVYSGNKSTQRVLFAKAY